MAGPKQVLEYLGRYTHRVAISNNRLLGINDSAVRFRWKNYRAGGRVKTMTLSADEFIRRSTLDMPVEPMPGIVISRRQASDALTIRFIASIAPTTAVRDEHSIENRAALNLQLTEDDRVVLDRAFLPPGCRSVATLAS